MKLVTALFSRQPRFQDLSNREMLRKFLPREKLNELIRSSADLRLLPQAVAQHLRMSERELLLKIAAQFGIRLKFDVEAIDYGEFPDAPSLEECRRVGSILNKEIDEKLSIVCVDPELVSSLRQKFPAAELRISSWYLIAKALDDSEVLTRDNQRRRLSGGESERGFIAFKVIEYIVQKLKEHKGRSVFIGSEGKRCFYRFQVGLESEAQGNIEAIIWPSMYQTLSQATLKVDARLAAVGIKQVCIMRDGAAGFLVELEDVLTFSPPEHFSDEGEEERVSAKIVPFPLSSTEKTIAESSPPANLNSRILLIVEDNKTFSSVLSKFISRNNMRAVICASSKEAREFIAASNELPGLTLCDLHLPGEDGISFMKSVRAEKREQHIPFIFLTSDLDTESELRALRAGAEVFLPKTVDPRIIELHIKRLLKIPLGEKSAEEI